MLLSYLKLSLRILARNPFITAINVFGLAIGITTFYCLWTYSSSELRANQFFQDYERIGRIGMHWIYRDDQQEWNKIDFGFSKSALLNQIHQDFSEMESGVRILTAQAFDDFMVPHRQKLSLAVSEAASDKIHLENRVIYADSNLFQFFSIPLIRGEAKKVLNEAGFVALSKSTAQKYFGLSDPIGQTLILNDSTQLLVSGVFEDLPHNTHFEFDIVISNKAYRKAWEIAHFGIVQNFVKIRPGVSFADFEELINRHRQKYWFPFLSDTTKNNSMMYMQPLQEIPYEAREGDTYYQRSKTILKALGIVSIAILVMAWANYINLSIAHFFKRIKEFETRKINGARLFDLINQSITEALLINIFALLVAFTLLQLIQRPLHEIFYIRILPPFEIGIETFLIFGGVFLFGILITGVYPIAFSGLNKHPISIFKKSLTKKWNDIFPFTLSIFQFSSSIVLILWAYIVFKELNFILNKDYGMEKEGVVLIEAPIKKSSRYLSEIRALKEKLSALPGVDKITLSKFALGDYLSGGKGLRTVGSDNTIGLDPNGVAEDYLDFYKLEKLAGRNLMRDEPRDKIIISRQAARRFGFKSPEDAVGSVLETTDNYLQSNANFRPVEIIGVIEDFRTTDFLLAHASRDDINNEHSSRGSVLTYLNSVYTDFMPERIELKIHSSSFNSTLHDIREEYKKIFPSSPFSWHFLNDHLNKTYQHERFARNQIVLFSIIAIGIASLGLLGNIAHKVNIKTYEISIRKILGAGMLQIMLVLIKSTLFQLVISATIGIPIAWVLGHQYMMRFSEKATFLWWDYFLPLAILMVILFSSILYVLIKAAKRNPVETLKHE